MTEVNTSKLFFPLRTNVEYFTSSKGYLLLKNRVKQASILYDEVMLESGMYITTIGERGNVDLWIPPNDLSEDDLKKPIVKQGGNYKF